MSLNIGFVIYENAQPIDFIGPWEVLSFWKNVLNAPINLSLISENGGYIKCSNEIVVKSHLNFHEAPQLDYLIVPGGQGRTTQIHNEKLISFIQKQAAKAKCTISVCTGTFLLHQAGLLKGKSTTTYWRALPELQAFSDVNIVERRIVKDGNIWASGGISSGIDLALELIAEIAGKEVAGEVQLLFEYFPRSTLFTTKESPDLLPPYYGNDSPPYLPKYIQEII